MTKLNLLKSILILCAIILFSEISFGQTPQYSMTIGTYSNTIPLRSTSNTRRDAVYYPSDFSSPPAGLISTIYLNVNSSASSAFSSLLIKMKSTSLTTFTTGSWTPSLDTVFFATSANLASNTNNWIPITLQTPFYYDGTSNFIVSISHIGYSTGITLRHRSVTDRSHYAAATSATATASNRLPNFGFDMILPSSMDAGISEISGFMDTICKGNLPVNVVLKNHGPDTLKTVDIDWDVNNISQTSFSWTGALNVGDSTTVNLGNYNFVGGTTYNLEAYTNNPNGSIDTATINDTASISSMYVRMNPNVNLGSDTTIYANQTITLDAGAGHTIYIWSTGATTQTIIVDSVGIGVGSKMFSVTAIDNFGCISEDSIRVSFATGVGVAENNAIDFLNVFPNPASDRVNINFYDAQLSFNLEVINSEGKKVFGTTGNNSLTVNTASWSTGLYLFVLKHEGKTTIKKVVID